MTEATTTAQSLRVDEQGQVVIPARLGHALGFQPGDALVARVKDGRLVIRTFRAIEEELWAAFADHEGSLVDELFAERRAEFRREMIEAGESEAEIERIEQRWAEAQLQRE